jgi:hypothetical protein
MARAPEGMEAKLVSLITTTNGLGAWAEFDTLLNLRRLAQVLSRIEAALGSPLHIKLAYVDATRMCTLGTTVYEHNDGRAAQFTCAAFGSPRAICRELAGGRSFYGFDLLKNEDHDFLTIIIPPVGVQPSGTIRA